MNVTLNGEQKSIEENITVLQLLESMNLEAKTIIVEKNEVILERDNYASELLTEGDSLELIRFMGGGAHVC